MNPIVSIIVPIYNVEEYIHECVDHLLNQTYPHLEIILVDDASPDNCPQICEEYAMKDPRIRVLHKPNGGLSDARNAGMAIATGEYFVFVDSDDYIVNDAVEQLVYMVERTGTKLACFGYSTKPDNLAKGIDSNISVANSKEMIRFILTENTVHTSAWGKIYHRNLFATVQYPKGKIYEDYATMYRLIDQIDQIAYASTKKYFYRTNPTSITGGRFYPRQLQYFEISEQVMAYIAQKYPYYKKHVKNRATRMAISFCKNISSSGYSDEVSKNFLVKYIRKNIFLYLFSGYVLRSKLYGLLLSICPKRAFRMFEK